jgi:deoxyadenosine/deoxycytidine kinase
MEDPCSVVQDRSLYEDAMVFARNLHQQGALSDRDWDTYQNLYRAVVSLLPLRTWSCTCRPRCPP